MIGSGQKVDTFQATTELKPEFARTTSSHSGLTFHRDYSRIRPFACLEQKKILGLDSLPVVGFIREALGEPSTSKV